jgi:murein DD-endopeptidase MepM/ murein hydrolase activator NlpD
MTEAIMRPQGVFGTLIIGIVLGAGGTLLLLSRVPLNQHDTASISTPIDRQAAPPAAITANPPATERSPAPSPPLTPAQAQPDEQQRTAGGPAPTAPGPGKSAGDSLAGMQAIDSSGTGGLAASGSGSSLLIPVAGVKLAQLQDTYNQPRGAERKHEALDIPAPNGTPVYAVADGKIAKLFTSKPGGLTIYQFDPGEKFSYYYAHLDHYASNLTEGQQVKRGEVIGYVGSTGNADPATPHLHFAMFELGPDKNWWQGKPVNPYPLLGHQ